MSGKTRRQILLLFELNSLKQFGAASSKLLFYEKDLTFGETLEKPKTKKQTKQSLFLVEEKLSTIFSDVA